MYNLSSQMKKWVTDPELIKIKNNNLNESFEGYILEIYVKKTIS